jgi:hypothetical protein
MLAEIINTIRKILSSNLFGNKTAKMNDINEKIGVINVNATLKPSLVLDLYNLICVRNDKTITESLIAKFINL